MIEFKNVSKTYANGTKALKDLNLKIEEGEFVFILGASGAGKSTFLKLIMREEVASHGEVIINGENLNTIKPRKIPYYRRKLGIVFQDFRLIPKMRVYDNIAFAMRAIGEKEKEVTKRVTYALSLVGLSSKAKCYPTELSGGEQQRVALARALVNNADIIIADEPTGNIDPEMSYEIVDLLNHINQNGTTVIMVTHEHELIKKFNNRVVTIKNGTVYSDTANPDLKPPIDELLSEPVISKGFYEAPDADAEVESFLQNYGNKDSARQESEAVASAAPKSASAPVFTRDVKSDTISGGARFIRKEAAPTEASAPQKDYSVYFETSASEEGGDAQ